MGSFKQCGRNSCSPEDSITFMTDSQRDVMTIKTLRAALLRKNSPRRRGAMPKTNPELILFLRQRNSAGTNLLFVDSYSNSTFSVL